MTNRNLIIGFALAVAFAVICFVAGLKVAHQPEPQTDETHDTIVRVDTFNIILPPDTITNTSWKTKYIHDTNVIIRNDSIFVAMPYEQHLLAVKDTFDLWFSGIDAKVDSIHFYLKTTTIEIHKPVKPQILTFYGGASVDWMNGGTAYKMFLEAQAGIGKKIIISTDGGLAVFDGKATPYLGATLKYKFN